jgi:hypothetical protein
MFLLCGQNVPGLYPDPIVGCPYVSYNVLQSVEGHLATVSDQDKRFPTHKFQKLIFTNHCVIDGGGPCHVPEVRPRGLCSGQDSTVTLSFLG